MTTANASKSIYSAMIRKNRTVLHETNLVFLLKPSINMSKHLMFLKFIENASLVYTWQNDKYHLDIIICLLDCTISSKIVVVFVKSEHLLDYLSHVHHKLFDLLSMPSISLFN